MAEQRTLDAERADFEAWHRSKFATKHSTGQPTRDMHNGVYAEKYGPERQQLMWEAWQAARRAPPALGAEELPEGEDHPALLKIMHDILTPSGWKKYKAGEEIALFPEHFRDIFKAGLRAQLASQSAPEGAPVGMVLVPVEPTDEMVVAFAETWFSKVRPIDDCGMEDCYAAMIAAAPTSASAQPPEGVEHASHNKENSDE